MLGLKTLPTRRTLSDPVLNRLVEDCRAAATVIYLKGCYITMSMESKSRAGSKLMGILCSNVGSADGRVATDFRETADITTVAESATLVQHEQNVKNKKQTFQPGSLCETAVDDNPVDGGVKLVQGAEGGFEGTVAGQDDDRDRLAASGPASQQQLREEQDSCRRAGEPLPNEERVDEVRRTADPAALSDEDLRAMRDNLMHGRHVAGGGGCPEDAARDGAAVAGRETRPRVLLSSLFDAEWYVKDAKAICDL